MNQDEFPQGYEAEHHECRDYVVTDSKGGRLSPRRVSPLDGEIHSRQATALHRRPYVLHVRSYTPANWFTVSGVNKKRKAIERRGLPSFIGWRFITLTLDPSIFEGCPLSGYLEGKNRMRRFLYKCRQAGLWADQAKWAWKMEFQSNGWVHWHLLVERRAKFSQDDLDAITRIWGLGRTSVERVRTSQFLYSFKYAFKAVYQQADQEGEAVGKAVAPSWFLDYEGSRTSRVKAVDDEGQVHDFGRAEKPVSFGRVRFWQTSKGFYLSDLPDQAEAKPKRSSIVPHPVRVASDLDALNKATFSAVGGSPTALGVGFSGPFSTTGFTEKEATVNAVATLSRSGVVRDMHAVTVRVKAKIKYSPSGAGWVQKHPNVNVVCSLKDGALATGKSRIPQPGPPEEEPPDPEEMNVGTHVTPWVNDAQGRPYQPPGPSYTLPGGQTGTWGNGTNWGTVTVPGGGGSGVPSWFSSGFPGSVLVTDNNGGKWLLGGQFPSPDGGLRDGGFTNGSVTVMPDGSVRVSAWGSSGAGWSNDWQYPAGTVPKEIDGVPEEEEEEPSNLQLDPCFNKGYTDATGDPPPGGTTPPEDPPPTTPPAPDGIVGELPGLPGLPGGSGGGSGGTGGGTGGGDDPIVMIPIPGYTPPPPAPSNPGPSDPDNPEPGQPLPEDSQPATDAKEMAKGYLEGVKKTQTAAERLMGWATITQFNPGIAGDWAVNLQIGNNVHAMVIPTTHAPLVRAILLLLLRVIFVVSVFRLLLS